MAEVVPASLGLPSRFSEFRGGQLEAAIDIAASDKRFSCLSAAPGFGKSPCYVAIAKLLDVRTLILTGTKNLQKQLLGDFSSIGLREIKGQGNYRCVALDRGGALEGYGPVGASCSDGPCHAGVQCCMRRGKGCLFYDDVNRAKDADLVVSNYAYHLANGRYGDPGVLGEFGLLICDEAHSSGDRVTDFSAVELNAQEVQRLLGDTLPPVDEGVDVWAAWARDASHKAARKADQLRLMLKQRPANRQQLTKELLRLNALERDLTEMARARAWRRTEQASKQVDMPGEMSDWIAYKTPKGARFTPIWSHQYSEELLFRGVKKVVLSSGTLMPSIVDRLGIPKDQFDWHEVKSSFDPKRRPIIYVPTTRVDNRMVEGQKRLLVNAIDRIVGARLDRKGIIHSVSYDRANEIVAKSKFGGKAARREDVVLMTHERGKVQEALEKFKKAKPPCVLVSPALVEGVDLPHSDCRFTIVPKVPFASSTDPLFKARCKLDPSYRFECAALLIVQMIFRGMRAAEDWLEVLVLDEHYGYLRFKTSWPGYVKAAWQESSNVPPPLKVAA